MIESRTSKCATHVSRILRYLPRSARLGLLAHYRRKDGRMGFIIRGALVKTLAKHCGANVLIFPDVYISHVDTILIGNNVSIHPMSYIDGSGGLSIGNDVSIAHAVTIMTTEHHYTDLNTPIRGQGYIFRSVTIGDNVWIGSKASVLAGTHIETGVIVAASAVVTKDCPSNAIVAGVPAKVLRMRGN